jgi:hypothetical protein
MATYTGTGQPPRPYATPDQVPDGAEFRSDAFRTGANQSGDIAPSAGQDPGLNLSQQQFAAQIPGRVIQTSVLQPANPVSANGMAAADFERVLPGMSGPMPSSIGFSTKSYQDSLFMRLQGRDEG